MSFGDTDRDAFLADFGVSVTYNGVTGKGLLDTRDAGDPEPDADESALGRWVTVLVRTDAFGALVEETAITVDGTACQLRSWDRQDDGAFTLLYCQVL